MAGPQSISDSGNIEINALLTGYRWDTTTITYSFPDSGWWYVLEQVFDDILDSLNPVAFLELAETFFDLLTEPQATIINAVQELVLPFADPVIVAAIALNDFNQFSNAQQDASRYAIRQYGGVANVTFTEVDEGDFEVDIDPIFDGDGISLGFTHGVIRFAETASTAAPAFGIPPLEAVEILLGNGFLGDTWYDSNDARFDTPTLGSFGHFTIMHELGHAMGLKHGHESGLFGTNIPEWLGSALTGVDGPVLPTERNSIQFSIMTYRAALNGADSLNGVAADHFAQSLMMLDIQALQYMYGANFGTNATDTVYWFDSATGEMKVNGVSNGIPGNNVNKLFLTIWDGNGIDTYDMSDYSGAVTVDLEPGKWSVTAQAQLANLGGSGADQFALGNVYNALLFNGDLRSLIENATGGGGNDTIRGNAAANLLRGGGGTDTLFGLLGGDTLEGGEGNDTLDGGADDDTLNGEGGDDTLTGAGGNDTLNGGANNDTLNGGVGDDEMRGGTGDDTYIVDTAGDEVIEGVNEGTDLVRTALSNYIMPDNVEDLEFTGVGPLNVMGNDSDNRITGNIGDDTIAGAGGNDTLTGNNGHDRLSGDAGNDTLNGGAGNDLLDGGADNDTVNGGDGNDQVSGGTGDDTVQGGSGQDQVFGGDGDDNVDGGAGHDDLSGEAGADIIHGGDGNDAVSGGTSADMLFGESGDDAVGGGDGDDTITGGAGIDNLSGEAGIDTVTGGDGNDTISGGGENDTLSGESGDDAIGGGDGDDGISGGAGNDNLSGEAGIDTIAGGDGNDIVSGGTGSDVLTGEAGDDNISGGDGDDYITEGGGADAIDGGAGSDTVDYSASSVGVEFNASQVGISGDALGDRLLNIEVLIGTAFADVLWGDAGNNTLFGLAGDDALNGAAGNDTLDGGLDADAMAGGTGADVYLVDNTGDTVTELAGQGVDRVDTTLAAYTLGANVENLTYTGAGSFSGVGNTLANIIVGGALDDILRGGLGADTLNGQGGNDTADYSASVAAVNVNLATNVNNGGEAAGDNLISIENVIGTAFNDTLTGDAANNILTGGDGNDTLNGGAGDDRLIAANGVDALAGGLGNDTFVVSANGSGTITELAGGGIDTVESFQTNYTLGAQIENLTFLGIGNFRGNGNALDNIVIGAAGSDILRGLDGSDQLFGGAGADSLLGGNGSDVLDGGLGADILDDNAGNDTFIFHAGDGGQDSLRGFTAGAGVGDVVRILGTAWASLADVLANSTASGNSTIIQLDALTSIQLKGVAVGSLVADDFAFV